MPFDAGTIVSKLKLDKSGWNQGISEVKADQKTLGDKIKANSAQFRRMGMAMTVAGGVIVGALGMMVKKASEAQEITTRFGTVFADVFPKATKAAKDLADNYGLSTMAARDLLGATGDLLTGLGMQGDVALSLSARTQQLAVDLASFTNFSGGAKGASEALTKAMLGERESVKSLGIVITEAMVKEHLLTQGKSKLTGQALLQAKAEATLAIALEQSKNAIGDYERTSTSLANVTRTLKGRLDDLIVSVGEHLIPIATDLAVKIKAVVENVTGWMKAHPGLSKWIVKITLGIGALMLVLGPLLIILPGLVTAFGLLTWPILAVVAAIAGLVAITILIVKNWKPIKKFFIKLWNDIKKAVEKIIKKMLKIILWYPKQALKNFKALRTKLLKLIPEPFKKGLDKAKNIVKTVLKWIFDKFDWLLKKLSKIPILKKFLGKWKDDLGETREEMTWTAEHVTEKSLAMGQAFVDVVGKSDLFKDAAGFLNDKVKFLGDVFTGAKDKTIGLGDEIETTRGKTKAYIDFLKDVGIVTIKEKSDRVTELEGFIKMLTAAYDDGEISLESYRKATNAARGELELLRGKAEDSISIIEDLGTAMEEELAAATKTATGEFDLLTQSFTGLSTAAPGIADEVEKSLDKIFADTETTRDDIEDVVQDDDDSIKNIWYNVADGIRTKWVSELSAALQKTKTWKDAVKAVWDILKGQLFDIAADIMTGWATNLLTPLVTKTANAVGTTAAGAATGGGVVGIFLALAAWLIYVRTLIITEVFDKLIDKAKEWVDSLQSGWDLLRAIQVISPPPGGGLPPAGGLPGWPPGWGPPPEFWPKPEFATGAEGITKGPMMPLIGEKGPEYFKIQPLSEMRRGGGLSAPSIIITNYWTITADQKEDAYKLEETFRRNVDGMTERIEGYLRDYRS